MSYKRLNTSKADWRSWYNMTSRQMLKRGRRSKAHTTSRDRIVDQRKHRLSMYNKRSAPDIFTIYEYDELVKEHDSKCVCCGVKETDTKVLGLDHVVPVDHGGSNQRHNLQPMCKECNFKKGTKTIDYRCSPPRQYLIDDKTLQVVVKELT